MTPDPTGGTVSTVEYVYRLSVVTDTGWYLTVENDFVASVAGSDPIDSSEHLDAAVALLASQVGKRLAGFDIRPDGGVTITLGHVVLTVEPDDEFEAWDIVGPPPHKQRVICMPGGELAIWS